ncbi:hypothetical protein APA_3292 [Pseudanabaena sp. lw0831]|nr:hypothetical protein APA_3292 [Pseudanabaena sp. lw0831]
MFGECNIYDFLTLPTKSIELRSAATLFVDNLRFSLEPLPKFATLGTG